MEGPKDTENLFGLAPEVLLFNVSRKSVEKEKSDTNLVLLTAVAKTRFPQVIHHRLAAHVIIVIIWHIVELAFKGLASGILAFTGNFADTFGGFEDESNLRARRTGATCTGSPERRREVVQDGREGC